MDFFQLLVLSVVQGVTEFLPVSSTGHLILCANLLGIPETEFIKSFMISIQAGTIFSVIFLYWRDLFTRVDVIKRIAVAFVPTAVIGLLVYKPVKYFLLGNSMVVLAALFIGGVALIVFELFHREKESDVSDIADIPLRSAMWIGVWQALAIIPGVSRSAATVLGGLNLHIRRKTIVEFSFLLAVPTMLCATALDLTKSAASFTANQIGLIAAGSLISFVVAILSIRFLLAFVQRFNFVAFGVYRILIAILFWYFG